jgi:hypothetical protein
MFIFHSLHKSPSFECRNTKLETQCATCPFFIYIAQITKCRVPSAETRSLGPKNMYATCSFFTHCTNHRVSSAKTQNSKPSVQSSAKCRVPSSGCRVPSSECRVPRPEAWDPKICTQHLHFSLVAQITEFQVLKPETRN